MFINNSFILHNYADHFCMWGISKQNYWKSYCEHCFVMTVSMNRHMITSSICHHQQHMSVYKRNQRQANLEYKLARNLVREVIISIWKQQTSANSTDTHVLFFFFFNTYMSSSGLAGTIVRNLRAKT